MKEETRVVEIDIQQAEAWLREGRDPFTGRQIVGKVPTHEAQPFVLALGVMFPLREVRGVCDPSSPPDDEGVPVSMYLTVEPAISREQAERWFAKMREMASNMPSVRIRSGVSS